MTKQTPTSGNRPSESLFLCFSCRLAVAFLMCLLIASCARMGQPDGGWFDETPPRILGSSPQDKSTDVSTKRITIYFDEFIKIDNPSEKVVVSPPQLEQPEIKGQGKRISIVLQDSLKDNTTYTIDFSDAITDNNEGNPLGNYTYSFSTGDHIDTLEVAGYVLEASNLEPIKGILVGLYRAETDENQPSDAIATGDTLFQTTPMLRVSRTDSRGRFVIKGVAAGRYRVYALQDVEGNYMFSQKGEKLAFLNDIVIPEWKPDVRQDTIWRDSLHISDIKRVPYTHFLPDNLSLLAFTEEQTDRYFLKGDRQEADRFTLFFSYGDRNLPVIRGLNFNADNAFVVEPSVNQDTITYWLRDTLLVNQDTLRMEMQYMATDTLGILRQQTDTLELLSHQPYARRLKARQEAFEKWQKKQEKRQKRGQPFETEMAPEPLAPEYLVPSSIDPDINPSIVMPAPIAQIDTAKIHLYTKIDTLWYKKNYLFGEKPGRPRTYHLIGEWQPGTEYSLEVDSAAFTDIYGKVSAAYKQGFKVRKLEEYSTLILTLPGLANDSVVVQLLNSSDKVVKEVNASGDQAIFFYVKPGSYYLRLFIDTNGNGRWDTGLYSERRQAERVCYYPGTIECRAKWDIRQTWDINAQPPYRQKPGEITKQKEEQKAKARNRNQKRAKDLGIDYIKEMQ